LTLKNTWVTGETYAASDQNAIATAVNANTAAIPTSGTLASRPAAAAGNSGAFYLCTDNDTTYLSNGTAWVKVRIGGDATSAMGDVPSTGWTAVNMQSGASFVSDKDSMLFTIPSGAASNYQYQYRTYPTPPFTLTTHLDAVSDPSTPTWSQFGIIISDGTKIMSFGPISGLDATATPTAGLFIGGVKFTNATTYSSMVYSWPTTRFWGLPKWFRVTDNATNLIVECSVNGLDWIQLLSEGRTAFLTPSRIGVCGTNASAKTMLGRLRSWNGVS
jgi:hypothetical protein